MGALLILALTTSNSSGAGEGNRTLVISLENFCSTIELHPRRSGQRSFHQLQTCLSCRWWRGKDSNLRTLRERIYSPSPLTTRPPLRTEPGIMLIIRWHVKLIAKRFWCRMSESNQRPSDYKSAALPTELIRLIIFLLDQLQGRFFAATRLFLRVRRGYCLGLDRR